MGKVTWNPGAVLTPVPAALVTCGTMENPKVLTVAWTGILNTHPPMTYISVRPERHSYSAIRERGVFAINMTTRKLCRATDFCGVRSGKDVDKFSVCGLTPLPGARLEVPILEESPISLECRVTEVKELGSHHMFFAEIMAVDVDDSLLDRQGTFHLEQAGLIAYAHGAYYALEEKLGAFGYSVRKKAPSSKSFKKKKETPSQNFSGTQKQRKKKRR